MKRIYNYRKMKRRPCKLPLLLTFIRGAIGKEYVIKHYRYSIIKTKYPDMTHIAPTGGQRSCREIFRSAVKQAQQVMRDPVKKAAWLKKVKQKHRLFNQLVKYYMQAAKRAAKKKELVGKYLIRSCFKAAANDTALPGTANIKNVVMIPVMDLSGDGRHSFYQPGMANAPG